MARVCTLGAMRKTAEVRVARPAEFDAARSCYLRNGYSGGLDEADRPVIALVDELVIGVVRLVSKPRIQLLRGMFIDEPYRGQGIGRRMLQVFEPLIAPGPCFMTCRTGLLHFYGGIGFRPIPDEQSPIFLRERVAGYRERHGDQVILRRDGALAERAAKPGE